MKILTVIGARPQFIKAAVVSRALAETKLIEEVVVHTGQHFDQGMSEVFFKELDMPKPDHNLGIHGLPHGAMTGRMLEEIEKVIITEKPNAVLVYGDTNSTLAGALAAKKLGLKLIHVEAGLRSSEMTMPEEINRVLTDRISDLLLCPTEEAEQNLGKEGIGDSEAIVLSTGDVMFDAVKCYGKLAGQHSTIMDKIGQDPFILSTMHRAENTDDPKRLAEIVEGLNKVNEHHKIVMPIHPRTKKALDRHRLTLSVKCIDPVGYFDMLQLLKHCQLVITDSGGLQKEAYFSMKHCVTLRDRTEWKELVKNGFNKLAGASSQKLIRSVDEMLVRESDFSINLYGDGTASQKVADAIRSLLEN